MIVHVWPLASPSRLPDARCCVPGGRDLMSRSEYSEEIASRVDAQVRTISESCYQKTVKLVEDNREVIDRLVDILVEKETIDGEEFRQIVAEYTEVPVKEQIVPQL